MAWTYFFSVFSLFIISTGWSVLSDVFNKDSAKRLFGIISAGASIGSIVGATAISFLKGIDVPNFIFISSLLLLLLLALKRIVSNKRRKS